MQILTLKLASDTVAAIAELQARGQLSRAIHWRFVQRNNKWGVEMWLFESSREWSSCDELLASLNDMPMVVLGR